MCYSPVRHWIFTSVATGWTPFDLHVLGTPPAFVLSQDQTLRRDLGPAAEPSSCDPESARDDGAKPSLMSRTKV